MTFTRIADFNLLIILHLCKMLTFEENKSEGYTGIFLYLQYFLSQKLFENLKFC